MALETADVAKMMNSAPEPTPEGIIRSFAGKQIEVEYHGGGRARGRFDFLGGGIMLLHQLDGRRRVIMWPSVITIVEATTVQ
ncbi:MAG: hypothetical protein ACRDRL_05355 [Sciscionella sp.]